MKFSAISLILSAGLAFSQVTAAPIRVVAVSEHVGGSGFIRVGHAANSLQPSAIPNVATYRNGIKAKPGCTGSFRNKANRVSTWFRLTFGLPPIAASKPIAPTMPIVPSEPIPPTKPDGLVHILPFENPAPGNGRFYGEYPHRTFQPHKARADTFVHRLARALLSLGVWEGRAVSFVLGCGIGVLLRMVWVLTVLAIRSIRGKRHEEEFLRDEVLFEEQEHLLPPQYVERSVEVKEKSETAKPTA